jgi:tetratricopeptide (TPR) repeat protein
MDHYANGGEEQKDTACCCKENSCKARSHLINLYMKKVILIILSFWSTNLVHAQPNPNDIDSLKRELAKTNADSTRVELLRATGYAERNITVLLQALALAQKIHYLTGEADCNNSIGNYFFGNSNYPVAMEFYLKGLQISEANNYLAGIAKTTGNIGAVYSTQGEYNLALTNFLKALTITSQTKNIRSNAIQCYDAARAYLQLGKLDSALFFGNYSYQQAIASNDSNALTNSLYTLGDIHTRLGNTALALINYRMAIPYSVGYVFTLPDIYVSMAKLFRQTGQMDSCIVYAEKGLATAQLYNNGDLIFKAAGLLSEFYEKRDVNKSFMYYKLAVAGKDSMFNKEKIKQIESLSFNEILRQQERETEKIKTSEERKHNLQYAAIAVGLIAFIILFLALSRSIIVKEKFIKFFGIVGLLAIFEFINLYIHPYLDKITNHTPFFMLTILICIGALLVPFHHRLEKWITHIMVEKNKKIRLAAAKKTIATLEEKQTN